MIDKNLSSFRKENTSQYLSMYTNDAKMIEMYYFDSVLEMIDLIAGLLNDGRTAGGRVHGRQRLRNVCFRFCSFYFLSRGRRQFFSCLVAAQSSGGG